MYSKTRHSRTNAVTWRARIVALACALLSMRAFCFAVDASTPPIPFPNAVAMALQHSGVTGIAAINQWRAQEAYKEVRANYIPQLTVGSALGYSLGFPLTLEGSAPSVVNFNSIQSLFNAPLQKYLKAAKIDWQATSFDVRDKRDAVILDTALTYAQLNQLSAKLSTLAEAQTAADKAEYVSQQRFEQGVDSKLDVTRSQLVSARIRLRVAEAQGQADVLRQHLANLLGVPASSIETDPSSMPSLPPISQTDDLSSRAIENSMEVKQAEQKTAAARLRAEGEHKATMMPVADFASQYSYLARFNNYDQYFIRYTPNNLAVGLNVRFPFFNSVQKAKAEEAKADAMMAAKQEDLAKERIRENTVQLQRSLRQLAAARDVAKLEWEVSQGDLDGVKEKVQLGQANVRDEQNGELDSDDKHAAYLDTEFELSRAELQLMRLTGELENWAIPTP
jgi:outer membrane protein